MPIKHNTYQVKIRHQNENKKPWEGIKATEHQATNVLRACVQAAMLDDDYENIVSFRISGKGMSQIHIAWNGRDWTLATMGDLDNTPEGEQ